VIINIRIVAMPKDGHPSKMEKLLKKRQTKVVEQLDRELDSKLDSKRESKSAEAERRRLEDEEKKRREEPLASQEPPPSVKDRARLFESGVLANRRADKSVTPDELASVAKSSRETLKSGNEARRAGSSPASTADASTEIPSYLVENKRNALETEALDAKARAEEAKKAEDKKVETARIAEQKRKAEEEKRRADEEYERGVREALAASKRVQEEYAAVKPKSENTKKTFDDNPEIDHRLDDLARKMQQLSGVQPPISKSSAPTLSTGIGSAITTDTTKAYSGLASVPKGAVQTTSAASTLKRTDVEVVTNLTPPSAPLPRSNLSRDITQSQAPKPVNASESSLRIAKAAPIIPKDTKLSSAVVNANPAVQLVTGARAPEEPMPTSIRADTVINPLSSVVKPSKGTQRATRAEEKIENPALSSGAQRTKSAAKGTNPLFGQQKPIDTASTTDKKPVSPPKAPSKPDVLTGRMQDNPFYEAVTPSKDTEQKKPGIFGRVIKGVRNLISTPEIPKSQRVTNPLQKQAKPLTTPEATLVDKSATAPSDSISGSKEGSKTGQKGAEKPKVPVSISNPISQGIRGTTKPTSNSDARERAGLRSGASLGEFLAVTQKSTASAVRSGQPTTTALPEIPASVDVAITPSGSSGRAANTSEALTKAQQAMTAGRRVMSQKTKDTITANRARIAARPSGEEAARVAEAVSTKEESKAKPSTVPSSLPNPLNASSPTEFKQQTPEIPIDTSSIKPVEETIAEFGGGIERTSKTIEEAQAARLEEAQAARLEEAPNAEDNTLGLGVQDSGSPELFPGLPKSNTQTDADVEDAQQRAASLREQVAGLNAYDETKTTGDLASSDEGQLPTTPTSDDLIAKMDSQLARLDELVKASSPSTQAKANGQSNSDDLDKQLEEALGLVDGNKTPTPSIIPVSDPLSSSRSRDELYTDPTSPPPPPPPMKSRSEAVTSSVVGSAAVLETRKTPPPPPPMKPGNLPRRDDANSVVSSSTASLEEDRVLPDEGQLGRVPASDSARVVPPRPAPPPMKPNTSEYQEVSSEQPQASGAPKIDPPTIPNAEYPFITPQTNSREKPTSVPVIGSIASSDSTQSLEERHEESKGLGALSSEGSSNNPQSISGERAGDFPRRASSASSKSSSLSSGSTTMDAEVAVVSNAQSTKYSRVESSATKELDEEAPFAEFGDPLRADNGGRPLQRTNSMPNLTSGNSSTMQRSNSFSGAASVSKASVDDTKPASLSTTQDLRIKVPSDPSITDSSSLSSSASDASGINIGRSIPKINLEGEWSPSTDGSSSPSTETDYSDARTIRSTNELGSGVAIGSSESFSTNPETPNTLTSALTDLESTISTANVAEAVTTESARPNLTIRIPEGRTAPPPPPRPKKPEAPLRTSSLQDSSTDTPTASLYSKPAESIDSDEFEYLVPEETRDKLREIEERNKKLKEAKQEEKNREEALKGAAKMFEKERNDYEKQEVAKESDKISTTASDRILVEDISNNEDMGIYEVSREVVTEDLKQFSRTLNAINGLNVTRIESDKLMYPIEESQGLSRRDDEVNPDEESAPRIKKASDQDHRLKYSTTTEMRDKLKEIEERNKKLKEQKLSAKSSDGSEHSKKRIPPPPPPRRKTPEAPPRTSSLQDSLTDLSDEGVARESLNLSWQSVQTPISPDVPASTFAQNSNSASIYQSANKTTLEDDRFEYSSWLSKIPLPDHSRLIDKKEFEKIATEAAKKDPTLELKSTRLELEMKDGKETKHYTNEKTDVVLTPTYKESGGIKYRNVEIEINKGPALVTLACSNERGKKSNPLVLEFDDQGKIIDSNIDLGHVQFIGDRPPIPCIEQDGKIIILPISVDKVLEYHKEIMARKGEALDKAKPVEVKKEEEFNLPYGLRPQQKIEFYVNKASEVYQQEVESTLRNNKEQASKSLKELEIVEASLKSIFSEEENIIYATAQLSQFGFNQKEGESIEDAFTRRYMEKAQNKLYTDYAKQELHLLANNKDPSSAMLKQYVMEDIIERSRSSEPNINKSLAFYKMETIKREIHANPEMQTKLRKAAYQILTHKKDDKEADVEAIVGRMKTKKEVDNSILPVRNIAKKHSQEILGGFSK
jgi:hypothetical protein